MATAFISMSSCPSKRDDRFAFDVVVLDDQQPLRSRGREVLEPVEGRFHARGRRRFGEQRERAARQDRLALLFHRDDLHRNVPRRRVELQVVQHRPAQHVGQVDVERDGGGTELPGQRQAGGPARGHEHLEALVARQAQQDAGLMRIVLDDQHDEIAVGEILAIVRDVLFAGNRVNANRVRLGGLVRRLGAGIAISPVVEPV